MDYDLIGKLLIFVGAVTAVVGLIFFLLGKTSLGKLPGDITFTIGNFTCVFPIVTMLIVSVILTIVLNFVLSLFRK